jgi:type I restriction enzyme M protein
MPARQKKKGNGSGRKLVTRQSVDQAVWSICDIIRRGNCAGAMQYLPEPTWILFLRILDEQEEREQAEREAQMLDFTPSLQPPYRWRDWAAPPPDKAPDATLYDETEDVAVAHGPGWKRRERVEAGQNRYFDFINGDLLPHLRQLKDNPNASARQKVMSQIMSGVERVRIDTERDFQDVLDKVHDLSGDAFDLDHIFALSQVYEGLLLRTGEKGNDGGQFFTPRQVIKAMVKVIDPQPGETVYDPGCGTGGSLAESYKHVMEKLGENPPAEQITSLKEKTFWGREKENQVYPIALANLILHGIDRPNIWHGNTGAGKR